MDAICSLFLSPFTPAPGLSVVTTRDWGGTEVLIEPPEYIWGGFKMYPDVLPQHLLRKLPWISQTPGVCLSIPHEWLRQFQSSLINPEATYEHDLAAFLRLQCNSESAWAIVFLAHAEDYDGIFEETIDSAIERLTQSVSLDGGLIGFVSHHRNSTQGR
ncbi:hypothetical protein [Nannocystis bainbridge]|uniref:Uncharacterized protein n=1 Tax=Nannocystis bainbridge TaxID=2995303 RepID=A0ABT5E7F7_9BACT|nr:hypothetical protein [Nannocystis bainbridge]MDC0721792.1 hypothetical protein [Nannocystis bainbridge]